MKADRHSCRLTEPDLAAAEGMGTERSRKDSKQWLSFLQACGDGDGEVEEGLKAVALLRAGLWG